MSTAIDQAVLLVGASTRSSSIEPVREHAGNSNLTPVSFSGVDSSTAREKWKEELLLRNGSLVFSGSQQRPPWVKPAFSKLQELVDLEPGWDSYDADSVVSESIVSAVAILNNTMPPDTKNPWIVPTVHGGIQMEWHKPQVDLEIEIEPDGTASIFYVNEQDGRRIEESLVAARVRLLLDEFK